jgi:hypothetical protein
MADSEGGLFKGWAGALVATGLVFGATIFFDRWLAPQWWAAREQDEIAIVRSRYDGNTLVYLSPAQAVSRVRASGVEVGPDCIGVVDGRTRIRTDEQDGPCALVWRAGDDAALRIGLRTAGRDPRSEVSISVAAAGAAYSPRWVTLARNEESSDGTARMVGFGITMCAVLAVGLWRPVRSGWRRVRQVGEPDAPPDLLSEVFGSAETVKSLQILVSLAYDRDTDEVKAFYRKYGDELDRACLAGMRGLRREEVDQVRQTLELGNGSRDLGAAEMRVAVEGCVSFVAEGILLGMRDQVRAKSEAYANQKRIMETVRRRLPGWLREQAEPSRSTSS